MSIKVVDEKELASYDAVYFPGLQNGAIRAYFYLNKGLDILNQFHNLFLGILGLYFVLKLNNPLMMVVIFLLAMPLLALAGWYNTHHMSKVMEWLSIRFGSHYSVRQFDLQQRQCDALEEIRDTLIHLKSTE